MPPLRRERPSRSACATRPAPRAALALSGALLLAASAAAQSIPQQIGYNDLVARLGAANVPTGATIGVGQVESGGQGGVNYGPSQGNSEFVGKTFTPMSGPPGSSSHATAVGKFLYGLQTSIAPAIPSIWLWEAANWLQDGYLKANYPATVPPGEPPEGVRLFNNSWVGSVGDSIVDNTCLRRADFAVRRDDLLPINGMNNGSGGIYYPLMARMHNGIAVGRTDGNHVSGPTPAGTDGPGRQKPEIVAPGSATSYTTPVVGAVLALLLETADAMSGLAGESAATHSATQKAVLLAGARHRDGWSNNPATGGPNRGVTATPLDPVYGVDVVNVDRSHLILTAGAQPGGAALAGAPTMGHVGWSLEEVGAGGSRWWTFTLTAPAEEFSVLATWHRVVASNFASFTMANFDLRLWRVDASGAPVSLVGDAGIPWFESGNVVSQSVVDNLEHLYLRNLQPGTYAIELDRIDLPTAAATVAIAWIRPEDPGLEPPVPGDLDGDGIVDGVDLGLLLAAFGTSDPLADLDGNGVVDGSDLGLLLANWSR